MAPPQYSDLGKNAKDVFTKGYHFGLFKLDVKTKTASGVELSSGGISNLETQNVFGTLETKYKIPDYGVTFLEKWNTDNTLSTEISIQDQLAKGLKLSFDSSFAPQTGQKSGHVKGSYANDICALSADVDVNLSGPVMKASSVFDYNGWLAGYQTKFDFQKSKLTQNNFALGYSTGDFILHSSLSDGTEFAGSIYQKVNTNLETGIQIAWSSGSNETQCGIGCKYNLDKDTSVRVKVNNSSQIGLGYQQKLREGTTAEAGKPNVYTTAPYIGRPCIPSVPSMSFVTFYSPGVSIATPYIPMPGFPGNRCSSLPEGSCNCDYKTVLV